MDRRRFITGFAIGGLTVVGFGTGFATTAVRSRKHPFFSSLSQVETWLNESASVGLSTTGAWPLATILGHCAQSIEFSLSGFPELKSATFRRVVGPAAYTVFSALGGTRHGLSELIPGTQRADVDAPLAKSLERLRAAIASFRSHTGDLAPHFAYGDLTHAQAERAHAMHFSEHLSEVVTPG